MKSTSLSELEQRLGSGRVKADFILAPYTTFKMGGPAEFFFEARTREDLIKSVNTAYETGLKLTILGGASNVIVSDKGIVGLVVRNMYSESRVVEESNTHVLLKVSSGYPIGRLVQETTHEGLSGFEYHMGLPGTLGGALFMNSKWTKPVAYMGDSLVDAELINDQGEVRKVDKTYFEFAYDHSILQKTKEILLTATFSLTRADPVELKKRAHSSLAHRKETQPIGVASSGCFFRNVDGASAGQIIDGLGLKGYSVGGLSISEKHANFVINNGGGTEKDFRELIAHIKQKAKDERGLTLVEEVVFVE